MALSLSTACFLLLSGVFFHHGVWKVGDWDEHMWKILLLALLIHSGLVISWFHLPFVNPNVTTTGVHVQLLAVESLHLAGVFASMFIYRAFFHPLHRFPGPFAAKLSIWSRLYTVWSTRHRHPVTLHELHQKHGDIVRYAPNQLSINLASAVPLIHGSASHCSLTKGINYLNPVNGGSVNAEMDPERHRLRRIKWEKALSSKAISEYEPRIMCLVEQLVKRLDEKARLQESVAVNDDIHLFTLDVIGAIGFGKPSGFRQLETGKLHPVIKHISEMMRMGVYMMALPWLHCLLGAIPTFGLIYKPDEDFRNFARDALTQRLGNKTDRLLEGDIMYSLTEPLPSSHAHNDVHLSDRELTSDALILTLGGSDTTTSASIHMLYRLARHQDIQTYLIRALIDGVGAEAMRSASPLTSDQVIRVPYLEAFISETLRLHPPAATGLPRVVPASGLTVLLSDGTTVFIPPGTEVSSPAYSLQRDPRNFCSPLTFLPERWLQHSSPVPEGVRPAPYLTLDKRALMTFGAGPYGCPGRKLAYVEMKLLIANLVRKFHVQFPDSKCVNEHISRAEEGWKDFSTVQATRLNVRLTRREL